MGHKTGCLIIHGFGGNTHEVEPLAKHLENKGFLTFCPNLKGHTGAKKALSRVSYKDWMNPARRVLKSSFKLDKGCINRFFMEGLCC